MTLAIATLSYSRETWIETRTDERGLVSAETCFMERTVRYTLSDLRKN
jgi:hypothetical protein